jgi:hypothetical protein
MSDQFIVGLFDDEEMLVSAAVILKNEGIKIYDIYTPFPVHGLDEVLDITRSRLAFITFGAGAFGLILSITFQVWTSAFDWPINVGGKPMLSIPAFIPVTFELTVLFGALATVAAFLFRSNLFPSKEAKIFELKQTDDKFLIVLDSKSTKEKFENISLLLKKNGATNVRLQN